MPPDYGKWGTVHQRFIRWQRKGMWKKLFEILKDDVSFAVNEHGMPVKFIVTERTSADCKKAINLLKNLDAKLVFADRAMIPTKFSCLISLYKI